MWKPKATKETAHVAVFSRWEFVKRNGLANEGPGMSLSLEIFSVG